MTDEVFIQGNHKRQYWNLNDTSESIGMVLRYLGSEPEWQNKLQKMMCFAWCNADMLDSAPTRNIANNRPHTHNTAKILQALVSISLHSKFFSHKVWALESISDKKKE